MIDEGESDDNDNNDDVKAMPQGLFDWVTSQIWTCVNETDWKDELTYLEEDTNDVAKEFFHSYISFREFPFILSLFSSLLHRIFSAWEFFLQELLWEITSCADKQQI